MTRRQNPEAEALIDRVRDDNWIECQVGIDVCEKKSENRQHTRVQEVSCDRAGVRVFVVDSDERRAYETRMREKSMERTRLGLEKVQTRVAKGRLKQPEMKPDEAVAHYKELNDVERGFHALKDPIGMRPIWHRIERRVRSHIFVAALAFLLDRMLERALRDAKVDLSATAAWKALQTIRHVRFRVHGEVRTGATHGSFHARHVLRALSITDLRPPTPPSGQETTT